MKRIIIVHPHFTIMGGAGRVMLELGKYLSSKYKIMAVSQQAKAETIQDYPEITFCSTNGPTTDSFLFWLAFPYWQLKTLLLLKKYVQPDSIIFVSVFPSNWIVFPLRLFVKNKIFWFCQEPSAFVQNQKWINAINSLPKKIIALFLNPLFRLIDYYLALVPNTIFANSKFSQANILQVYNRQSIVFCPGVNTSIFRPIPYSSKENYILTVSRLTKFKNIDTLIKAFSAVYKKKLRLKIVGNGEELNNLQKLSQELNVDKKIDFMTDVSDSDIIPLFQKAKLVVLCSKDEPFGIVPIEAMACGTPVVADNSGGLKETIVDGKTGTLMDNMSSLNLAKYLNLSDKTLRKLSENCRVHIMRNFDWKVQSAKLLRIIDSTE